MALCKRFVGAPLSLPARRRNSAPLGSVARSASSALRLNMVSEHCTNNGWRQNGGYVLYLSVKSPQARRE